jgi:hypothetical protein
MAAYIHITYPYRQATHFSEIASFMEKILCVIKYTKTNSCSMFRRPSGNGFIGIHLLEHRHRGGLATLRTRAAFVRRTAVTVLI